jgi:hypothetical protein
MQILQRSVVQSFRRAQTYLDDNVSLLGAINTTEERKTLDEVVALLDGHTLALDAAKLETVGETNRKAQLDADLREVHMRPIATFAKAKLRGVPNFKAMTTLGRFKGARRAAAARAMAQAATPYAAQFIAAQFPADFLDQITKAADAVDASIDIRSRKNIERVGAAEAVAGQIQRGRDAVGALSGVVLKLLAGNSQLLAEWNFAKRVPLKPGATTKVASTPVPLPVTTIAPAPIAPAPITLAPAAAPQLKIA